jgi:hypothetical protein
MRTFWEWSLEWKLRVAKTQEALTKELAYPEPESKLRLRMSTATLLPIEPESPGQISWNALRSCRRSHSRAAKFTFQSWSPASIFRLSELTAAQLQHGVNMIPLSKLLHCNASLTLPPSVSQPALTGSTFSTVSLHHRPKLPPHWGQNTVAHTPPRCEWGLRKGICRQNSGA